MSAVALWRLFCCNRIVAAGRYGGNRKSTSGFYPKEHCEFCNPPKPRPGALVSTCEFFSYTFDSELDYPYSLTQGFRPLTIAELERVLTHDREAREKLRKNKPHESQTSAKTIELLGRE